MKEGLQMFAELTLFVLRDTLASRESSMWAHLYLEDYVMCILFSVKKPLDCIPKKCHDLSVFKYFST